MNTTESSQQPTYTIHFLPCKINKDIKTEEFKDSFINENLTKNNTTLYLRGRKLIGKEIIHNKLEPYIFSNDITDIPTTDNTTTIHKSKLKKLNTFVNYEREGNEQRLIDEHNKLYEFIDLTNLIHDT